MTHRIIPRAEWGARYDNGAGSRKLPAREAWLHHTVTIAPDTVAPFDDEVASMRDLERIGQSRFGRGISYTRLVFPGGNVYEGHSIDRIGAHTAGHNTVAVAYSLVGNYEVADMPDAMVDAVAWALAHDFLNGWIDAVPLDGGHRDLKATACPGRFAYALIGEINRRAKAHVDGAIGLPPAPTPVPGPAPTPTPVPPTAGGTYAMDRINLSGSLPVRGRHVDNLQALLLPVLGLAQRTDLVPRIVTAKGIPDGVAGAGTAEALEVAQRFLKFVGAYTGAVDRDCGAGTWKALIEA